MALRRLLGCIPVAALALCAWTGCKDKDKETDRGKDKVTAEDSAGDLNQRCEQLGTICGEKDKHRAKVVDECTLAATQQLEKGCADKAVAVYDCYERELCGKGHKVWALDDFRVLAERHSKCMAERDALRSCVEK